MALKTLQIKMDDVPGVPTPTGTTLKVPIHPEVTGTPQTAPISFLIVIMPPGSSTSLHAHDDSDEYEYVLSGTGELEVGDKKGIPVEADMAVVNLRSVMHEIKNTGKDTMRLLRIHVPPLKPGQPGDAIDKTINEAKKAFDVTKGTFKSP